MTVGDMPAAFFRVLGPGALLCKLMQSKDRLEEGQEVRAPQMSSKGFDARKGS